MSEIFSFESKEFHDSTDDQTIEIGSGQYNIVQIGCGIVGNAYVDAYIKAGCQVTGLEASDRIIDKLKDKINIYHIDSQNEIASIKNVDYIMISVCTPLKDDKLDTSYLYNTIPNVALILRSSPNAIVVIRSTVPPETTIKYQSKLQNVYGDKVSVAFQPEFLRAASAHEDAENPWHIVCGVNNEKDAKKLIDLYSKFVHINKISIIKIEEAEMLKMFHNCFNAAKISFFNQCGLLIDSINQTHAIDINIDVITQTLVKTCEGLKNPKYGTLSGHAYYGSCLPKDSAELASLEKTYGLNIPLFDAIVKVNNEIKKKDTREHLVGDFHLPFNEF